jgi:hypothetical protein
MFNIYKKIKKCIEKRVVKTKPTSTSTPIVNKTPKNCSPHHVPNVDDCKYCQARMKGDGWCPLS